MQGHALRTGLGKHHSKLTSYIWESGESESNSDSGEDTALVLGSSRRPNSVLPGLRFRGSTGDGGTRPTSAGVVSYAFFAVCRATLKPETENEYDFLICCSEASHGLWSREEGRDSVQRSQRLEAADSVVYSNAERDLKPCTAEWFSDRHFPTKSERQAAKHAYSCVKLILLNAQQTRETVKFPRRPHDSSKIAASSFSRSCAYAACFGSLHRTRFCRFPTFSITKGMRGCRATSNERSEHEYGVNWKKNEGKGLLGWS